MSIDLNQYSTNIDAKVPYKVQIEHILNAIYELENSIVYLTTNRSDPQYLINLNINREIRSLYALITDIIEKDILKFE